METIELLYITESSKEKNGHEAQCELHHKMLKNIFKNRIFSIYIGEKDTVDKNELLLTRPTQIEKIISVISGTQVNISRRNEAAILNVCENIKPKYVYIENSTVGHLVEKIKKRSASSKVILYYPDIEAVLLKKSLKHARFVRKIGIINLIENEKKATRKADYKIVLNERDSKLFKSIYGVSPDLEIPITVSDYKCNDMEMVHDKEKCLNLLFVGVDYWPNIVGLEWLINKVIKNIKIDCKLTIVGYGLEKYKNAWEKISSKIEVVGKVNSLDPWYEKTDAVIAPIRDGGGMKVKTAEALMHGKKFIGLEESLIGYWENIPSSLKNNGIFKCSNENEMLKVLNLLFETTFFKFDKDINKFAVANYSPLANENKYAYVFKSLDD